MLIKGKDAPGIKIAKENHLVCVKATDKKTEAIDYWEECKIKIANLGVNCH